MDYRSQPLSFKVKKALRYVRLYGVSRTWVKIQGQYHSARVYDELPPPRQNPDPRQHVGLIGCGNFAYSHIAYYLKKNYGRVIRAAMDVNINKAASLFERYGLSYYTDDAERIIADDAIDLVYIASNHASHAEYAIRALERGKHVHIEKPHVVNEDQLERLAAAMQRSSGKVALGFNRPGSSFGRMIKSALDSQSGAAMHNWFIAGHEIPPDHWYFKGEEGGRVLGNLCHWTDFVYQMVPPEARYPISINPTRARQSDCDIGVTYVFGDGTVAAITFSAKGHTFEGVRERYAAHRGNVLLAMDDFKTLTVENIEDKRTYNSLHRNHGHEANIRASYDMARNGRAGCTPDYVIGTGALFLKTREALETKTLLQIARP